MSREVGSRGHVTGGLLVVTRSLRYERVVSRTPPEIVVGPPGLPLAERPGGRPVLEDNGTVVGVGRGPCVETRVVPVVPLVATPAPEVSEGRRDVTPPGPGLPPVEVVVVIVDTRVIR